MILQFALSQLNQQIDCIGRFIDGKGVLYIYVYRLLMTGSR